MKQAAIPLLISALLGAVVGGVSACGGGGATGPVRSALLITLDTTRADALTCYGGEPGVTPHLDRLAAEGVLFERVYTVAPLTLPSHLSMLTGLYPPRHGVRDNGHQVLSEEAMTLAESARAAGLSTAAFISASVLHQDFGIGQGFEVYDAPADDEARATTDYPSRRAHEIVARAGAWLRGRDRTKGFFLWVHMWDPHHPHEAPARFRQSTPYLSEVASADDAVGLLLAALEAEVAVAGTTVVVVGDHGEAFGEHGETTHGAFVFEATLRVPLLVRFPDGRRAGERVDRVTSVVDVYPTLAEALGLRIPERLDGRSLFADGPRADGAYFETYYGYFSYGWSPLAGWVDDAGKYVQGATSSLYDPRRDPGETQDLAAARGDELERYRGAIARLTALPALAPAADKPLNPALQAAVRATGYAGGATSDAELPGPLDATGRPDPRGQLAELEGMERGHQLLGAGRTAEALAVYARVVEDNPQNLWCRELLAHCLIAEKRFPEAILHLQAVVEGGRAVAETYGNLGGCLLQIGREELALSFYLQALELGPNRRAALYQATRLLEKAGRSDEAAPLRRRFRALTGEDIPPGH